MRASRRRLQTRCYTRDRVGSGGPVRRYDGTYRATPPAFAAVFVFVTLWSVSMLAGLGGATVAGAAERALSDATFQIRLGDPAARAASIAEFKDLHTRWVRVDVSWAALEPSSGAYDGALLTDLDAAVDELRAGGRKVLFTVSGLPGWAADRSYGGPPGASPPIRKDALDDFSRLGELLAARFGGRVRALECWNEPNLWPYLYPQRTVDDPYFAARTYLGMLKAFYAGVKRGDPDVLVVAGATAPLGTDDRARTSPQRFARFLADHGAARYFDVYSHHPYTPGGSLRVHPEAAPSGPSDTVTLQNLPTLLRLFPTKPFYLTEYGYNTRYTVIMGVTVSKTRQAGYLRRAYAYVRRFRQVKLLCWFLARDLSPAAGLGAEYGYYTGLREADGDRKLSWFAFAGGNHITIDAPTRIRPGRVIRVSGRLTNSSVGPLGGRRLVLQSRRPGTSSWRTVSGVTTDSAGGYRFSVKPGGSRAYRVVWRGVKTSPSRSVIVAR